ncbi:hypothetical protein NE237_019371 [Protea cynaroides]|uniref:Multidrug and toxin extrusion protein n=1 Tax=Protea cynaroides TaxID=273540 RepID=A0A9Q0KBP7_9MAGN|nr:hypothetical protein NE237_019371 [Protea cynaroides]
MCNPNTTTPTTNAAVIEKRTQSPKIQLYWTLLSLPKSIKELQNQKPENLEKQRKFTYPEITNIINETKSIFNLSFPIVLTAFLVYSRSIISMLFLGHLGDLVLAAGSLAIAFANITNYSILSRLALGMEPLCAQAFGAQRPKLMFLTLHCNL